MSAPGAAPPEDPERGPLAWLLRASIDHRGLVIGLSVALAALGLAAARELPLDAFPDTTPIQVAINTTAPTFAPEEVERQVTFPVEQRLGGLPGLAQLRSLSRFGLSQVVVTFRDGTDPWLARQVVAERLQQVELPAGVSRPALGPVATGLGEVFHYLVRGEGVPLTELRRVHDRLIAPALRVVPGVAEVVPWGGAVPQVHVLVDPERLRAHGLTPADLAAGLARSHGSAGGGPLAPRGGQVTLVQGLALLGGPEDVAALPLAQHGATTLRVGDVARVVAGHEVRRGAVTALGRGECVLGLGFALTGENAREVTLALAARLEEVRATLPPGVRVEVVHQRTALVDRVLRTVRTNLLEGALLVVAVLFAFLGDLRAGLIVALAIPLSLLCACDLMLRAGIAGSLMSLGAIDFGLVVDSSVILVEHAARRLGESPGLDPRQVVRAAALEVRRPTLAGELVIALVYVPILALEGVEGKLFRPMALTVVFALLGSLLLSLTLVPALASLLLRPRAHARPPLLMRALLRVYLPLLDGALRRPLVVLAGAAALTLAALGLLLRLGSEFVPRLQEGAVVINTVRLASVSLEESVRAGEALERLLLRELPDEVEAVWTRTGTPEVATDPMGLELSDVFVTLAPRERWRRAASQEELLERMRALVAPLPGMKAIFTQPIEMRVNEMLGGVRADLAVALYGDDLEVLRVEGQELQRALSAVPGATDVSAEQLIGLPVLQVLVDRAACARQGVDPGEALRAVELLGGARAGEVREGAWTIDLVLRLDESFRADPLAVAEIPLRTLDGGRALLRQVARLQVVQGPALIQHEAGRRRALIQANVRGRDLGSFVADARGALAAVPLPPGYRLELGGQWEHLQRARARLWVVIPLALLLVALLLHLTYGRTLDVLRVLTGVPLAAVGGVFALALRDLPLSLSAVVGFVALAGISVLGDMVLVSTIRGLLARGMPLLEAVREAAASRLRPVLMTGLVASLGFLPMALSQGPGAEVQRPLATVVVGGVLSSTLLTLLVLPVLYALTRGAGKDHAVAPPPSRVA